MKRQWEYKKLGEVCEFDRGLTYSSKDEITEMSASVVLRSNNIDLLTHKLNLSDLKYLREDYFIPQSKKVRKNSILICMSNGSIDHLGKTAFIDDNLQYAFGGFMGLITTNQMKPRFCFYILNSTIFTGFLNNINRGVNIRNLQWGKLAKLPIPVPPLPIQEQIVAELDKINEVIADNRELLKKLDALEQALFYDTFGDPVTNPKGWKVAPLSQLVTEKLSYGSGASGIPYNGEIRYIRITDIDENGQLKDEIASSPSEFDPKYLLKQDDILFARSGATVGKTFLYQEKIGKAIYAGYLICASLDKSLVSPTFVYLLTKTIYYAQYIKRCIRGVAQPNVNAQQYSALPIPVPPLSLQQRFAQQIEAIEQQKAHVEENIQKLQTLLDSRMAYWFQ